MDAIQIRVDKVKGKVVLLHAIRTYVEENVQLLSILISAL
jgi:hypothetical protein